MLAMTLPDALEARLKEAARQHGKPVELMAADAIGYWLEAEEWAACRMSGHEPNEETVKAIEESIKGTGNKTYSSPRELFEELEREC